MRLKGTLVEWNDDRGFGFLEPAGGGERAFSHISQFARHATRPAVGERLTYELSRDKQGRLRAMKIQPIALSKAKPARNEKEKTSTLSPWIAVVGALLFFGLVSAPAFNGRLPILVPAIYIALSVITIFAYAFDKSAAMNRRWRTEEATLHALSLFGGWPDAWFAQLAFRHKTKKTSFVVTFVLCVLINLVALGWVVMNPEALAALGRDY